MAEKLDRDALKGPDEFTLAVRWVVERARTHRRSLTVGITVVATVVIVGSIVTWNRARQTQQAAEQFRQAHAAFREARWGDASQAFEDVARDYSSTPFGRFAMLYQGHALRAEGARDAAALAYEAFLASGELAPEFRQQALVALGQIREDAGQRETAVDFYERAAGIAGPYRLEAEMASARLQLDLGRRDDARATYERILPDASGDVRALVEARLAALSTGL
jgi:tetratricopeptide (TPR) repeat protein